MPIINQPPIRTIQPLKQHIDRIEVLNSQKGIRFENIIGMKTFIWTFLFVCFYSLSAQSQCLNPTGDEVSYGSGSWIGYVYDGANNFSSDYYGFITEAQNFDDFNTGDSLFTSDCVLEKTTFSVRFKMNATFTCDNYVITVGGDDGVRLSLDGGSTYFINGYVAQPYATYTDTVLLDGNYNFVLEYYEQAGQNRVSFNITPLGQNGDGGQIGSNQSFCGSSSSIVDPGAFTSAAAAGFCTGSLNYQWQISSDNLSFSNIGGATSVTYDAPSGFPNGATRYYRRQANNGTDTVYSNTVNVVSDTIQGDQVSYGAGSWIGYVYDGANNFSDYQGFITEPELFDESFGGNSTTFAVNGCDVFTETYTVRYRMQQTFACGDYTFTVGADDGVRLSLDGGSTYLINDYSNHGYRTSSASIQLDGSYNLVLDYFENGGGNRVSFDYSFAANNGDGGTIAGSQQFCVNGSVDPAAFTSTTDASFCSGTPVSYQWQESSDNSNFSDIAAGNTSTFNIASFPAATTTYYRRRAIGGTDTLFSNTLTVENLIIQGDETTFGSGNWIGYVYDGANNFNTANYRGFVTEAEQFDQNFGGNNTSYSINGCPITTETFTVRYKMTQTFASGTYDLTIAGDDGVRLSVDGGSTFILDGYNLQAYTSYNISTTLSGSVDLVLEYYEQGGANRVSFNYAFTSGTSWIGAVNTDWSNAGNWSSGVPDCTLDAVISSTATNMPTINSDVNVRSIIIESGATLTIAGSNSLNLCGDWNNQGSFVANQSTVSFVNQDRERNIQSASTQTFYNLDLNDNQGMTLSGATTQVHRGVTMSGGGLNTNGLLTLLSDASSTGWIGPIPSGESVTGDVEVQRFIGTTTAYNLLGSPIQNTTLEMWDDDLITAGFTGSDFPSFSFNSIQNYDESTFGDKDNFGWFGVSNITEPVEAGSGRMVYIGPSTNVFIDAQGTINQGSINYTLSYTDDPGQPASQDGWNMVANPYPCTIDWLASSGWTKTNLNNAVQVWRADLNQFAAFVNGVSTNGGSRYIPSSQGFWVQANASNPVMTTTEAVKSPEQGTFLRVDPGELLRLKIAGVQYADETVLRFLPEATPQFDAALDAQKLHSVNAEVPSLSTMGAQQSEYAIQSLSDVSEQVWVPLNLKVPSNGSYLISIPKTTVLTYDLYLEDQESGQRWPLREGVEISLDLTVATPVGRYVVRTLEAEPTVENTLEPEVAVSPNPFSLNEPMQVQLLNFKAGETVNLAIYSLQGALILQQTTVANAAGLSSVAIGLPELPSGTYLLTAQTATSVWRQKIVGFRP